MELADGVALSVFYSGAFLMPLVAARIGIPSSVAEILFGLAVGAAGVVGERETTSFLAELGFIYLMFLVGMEIDFNRIEREGARTVLAASAVAILVLAGGAAVARALGMPPFMALVLGAMSVGVLLVVLRELGASQSRWGQTFLLVGSIGEFLTLMTLTFLSLTAAHGGGFELGLSALEVTLLFLVSFVLLASLRLLVWWFPHAFRRWVSAEDPSELGVRFGFVLMLALATLAVWVGLESILGAFLAGILFTFVFRETGHLETKLVALGQGFFVPLFFINVGVTFDWEAVSDPLGLGRTVLALGAVSLVVKLLPSLLLLALRIPLREVLAGAFLLATPLTLLVAIAALGAQIGAMDPATSAGVILLATAS
ncbi:MAG: cation:proton antiporter, partial [Vicinamibacteria bacterium]